MPDTVPSSLDGAGLKVAVLTAQWHRDITGRLQSAALGVLAAAGVADDDILVVAVPGAYELPQAAAWIARAGEVDLIVALGCVIRGETPHFDYVAEGCADGLLRIGLETGVPIGLGVITADTRAQAEARSAPPTDADAPAKGGNKGVEATDAAVRMAHTYRTLEARRRRS